LSFNDRENRTENACRNDRQCGRDRGNLQQRIADRIAAFETEPRSTMDIAEWFAEGHLVVVAETREAAPVAFAASFPYSIRACCSGIGEFSVYVRRDYRGRGAGRAVLAALIEEGATRGMHKLTSRVFPENVASRALLKRLGFAEIGIHRRHGQLDGLWRDCVIVERLLEAGYAVEMPLREHRGGGAYRHSREGSQ
jgi:phosphinothricin acetyltransferase